MTTIQEPANVREMLENLRRNFSQWKYADFLRETGFSDDFYGREKWGQFRNAATGLLNPFDNRTLAILFSAPVQKVSGIDVGRD